MHLSSIGGQVDTLAKIWQTLRSNQDTKLSWNPGRKELELLVEERFEVALIPCEVFVVNREEWALVEPLHEEILLNFPQVIVTKGKSGGELHLFGKKSFEFVGQSTVSVDNTGAGDAFAAGYVAALLYGLTPEQAIAWGVKNAGNVVAYFGGKSGLLRHSQILQLTKTSN